MQLLKQHYDMISVTKSDKACDLPATWDLLTEDYFQQRCFLTHAEKFNPCNQRYYMCVEEGRLLAAAIVYTLRIDLFAFSRLKSPVKMHVTGIPCSVSSQGIFGDDAAVEHLKNHICDVESGFLLMLNLRKKTGSARFVSGNTFPTFVIENTFSDWQGYFDALRSGYKRRIRLINQAGEGISFERLSCREFTPAMYQQYLQVYQRSEGKLERLNMDFFVHLPPEFLLTVCKRDGRVIGWNIGLFHQEMYYFFLGGIDYAFNKTNQTYLRLLTQLVKDGIESGAKFIELGQTAGIAKMRMGGRPVNLRMEAHHRIKLIHRVISMAGSLLEYRQKTENTNAFKTRN